MAWALVRERGGIMTPRCGQELPPVAAEDEGGPVIGRQTGGLLRLALVLRHHQTTLVSLPEQPELALGCRRSAPSFPASPRPPRSTGWRRRRAPPPQPGGQRRVRPPPWPLYGPARL